MLIKIEASASDLTTLALFATSHPSHHAVACFLSLSLSQTFISLLLARFISIGAKSAAHSTRGRPSVRTAPSAKGVPPRARAFLPASLLQQQPGRVDRTRLVAAVGPDLTVGRAKVKHLANRPFCTRTTSAGASRRISLSWPFLLLPSGWPGPHLSPPLLGYIAVAVVDCWPRSRSSSSSFLYISFLPIRPSLYQLFLDSPLWTPECLLKRVVAPSRSKKKSKRKMKEKSIAEWGRRKRGRKKKNLKDETQFAGCQERIKKKEARN